jgi:hypothetical protein
MYNKEIRADFVTSTIAAGKGAYGGSFFFDLPSDKEKQAPLQALKGLMDPRTVDIVSPRLVEMLANPEKYKAKTLAKSYNPRDPKKQKIYASLNDYFGANPPSKNVPTFYLVGDAYEGSGNQVDVHWNCFCTYPEEKAIVRYDPAEENDPAGDQYNFSLSKVVALSEAFRTVGFPNDEGVLTPPMRAQQVCMDPEEERDIFCQSWVVLFPAVESAGLWEDFEKIRFDVFHDQPLRAWLNCVLKSVLKGYGEDLKAYATTLQYCRLKPMGSAAVVATKVPEVTGGDCTRKIIEHFVKLSKALF